MRAAASSLVKHFLILCPREPAPGLVEKLQASSDLHWRLLPTSHGAAIFVEPRGDTDSASTLPVVCGDNQDLNPDDSEFLGNGILTQEVCGSPAVLPACRLCTCTRMAIARFRQIVSTVLPDYPAAHCILIFSQCWNW
jgi:hypothetical protein